MVEYGLEAAQKDKEAVKANVAPVVLEELPHLTDASLNNARIWIAEGTFGNELPQVFRIVDEAADCSFTLLVHNWWPTLSHDVVV